MSLHVVKKILAPGKGSEIGHLVSLSCCRWPGNGGSPISQNLFVIRHAYRYKIPEKFVLKCLRKGYSNLQKFVSTLLLLSSYLQDIRIPD